MTTVCFAEPNDGSWRTDLDLPCILYIYIGVYCIYIGVYCIYIVVFCIYIVITE